MVEPALILDAFTALVDDDADALQAALDQVATPDLLEIERLGIRLVWACRDERREHRESD